MSCRKDIRDKKMENYRRGGNDRRTEGRSDYGRRNQERNFSGGRNSRFSDGYSRDYRKPRHDGYGTDEASPAAPRRRPRVIRGKDGELRNVSAGSARPSYARNESGERRGSGYGERRRFEDGGHHYGNRRPAGGTRTRPERPERRFAEPRKPRIPVENGISRMLSRKRIQDESSYSDNDSINIPVKEEVRLNKFIANSGICSRREADNYIQAGVVTVNGEVVTELGTKVNIYNDDVRFNGERLKGEEKVYVVMNKPKGYVTTASDPHAEKTVMDLLKGCKARVFPVGRLDKYTTGVLMFTNDGEIAEKLTHPSYDKKKIYQVTLDKDLTQEDYEKIKSGVLLSDGEIAADELEYVEDDNHKKIGIEIHSGKNRIVRRIFESLGYEVRGLDRVYFAGLTKKGLKRGQWRFLTQGEENILKIGAYN